MTGTGFCFRYCCLLLLMEPTGSIYVPPADVLYTPARVQSGSLNAKLNTLFLCFILFTECMLRHLFRNSQGCIDLQSLVEMSVVTSRTVSTAAAVAHSYLACSSGFPRSFCHAAVFLTLTASKALTSCILRPKASDMWLLQAAAGKCVSSMLNTGLQLTTL